jgi:RHS repeat-associated protein
MLQGTAAYYVSPGHLGSPRIIQDATGKNVWLWDPPPHGGAQPVQSGAFTTNLRFPGQYFDSETKLHHNGHRDYDPNTTFRYIQSDPIGLKGGINTYAYARNNPVNLIDPLGLYTDPMLNIADRVAGIGQSRGSVDAFTALGVLGLFVATDGAGAGLLAGGECLVARIAAAEARNGTTVLGHFPEYLKKATELGARRFSVPEKIWNEMSDVERWTANTKFLERTINRGDDILLATPLNKVTPGSYFERELEYLSKSGYRLSTDGTRLVPGGN